MEMADCQDHIFFDQVDQYIRLFSNFYHGISFCRCRIKIWRYFRESSCNASFSVNEEVQRGGSGKIPNGWAIRPGLIENEITPREESKIMRSNLVYDGSHINERSQAFLRSLCKIICVAIIALNLKQFIATALFYFVLAVLPISTAIP